MRNKSEMPKQLIGNKTDIFIYETKLDDIFPLSQFFLGRFTPTYRLDKKEHDAGLLLFVRDEIPSTLDILSTLKIYLSKSIQNKKVAYFRPP